MNCSYDAVSKSVRTKNAETKRKHLLDIISRNAEDSRSSLMARNELAQMMSLEEGLLDEAIKMQKKTLELQRGRNDVDLKLVTLSNLSFLYETRNQFTHVEETLKQELALRRGKSGTEDPETLVVMWHLARAYIRLGKFQDAATLLKRVISLQERACGDDHYDTQKSRELYESLRKEYLE